MSSVRETEMVKSSVEYIVCDRCRERSRSNGPGLKGWVCCHLLLPSEQMVGAALSALFTGQRAPESLPSDEQHLCPTCWSLFESFMRAQPYEAKAVAS